MTDYIYVSRLYLSFSRSFRSDSVQDKVFEKLHFAGIGAFEFLVNDILDVTNK